MSELGDYRRLVEKPMIAKYEADITRLQEALQQLVDYVKDGCPDDGRYYVMTESQAALKGMSICPDEARHNILEEHDVLVARGEAEPF